MKNDFIEIGEAQYRVEFNWNTISNFLESEELELSEVDNLKLLKPKQITGLIYAGVVEGCRMDGKEFPLSKLDFGAMIGPKQVGELMLIYVSQTTVKKQVEENKSQAVKKKRLSLFR